MVDFFRLYTPITYWILIVMWGIILGFYIRKSQGVGARNLFSTLLFILAIDASRTLFESLYFGVWYTSLAGMLPRGIADFLMKPEIVVIPKTFNLIAAFAVIFLLLKRWIPQEEERKVQADEAIRVSEAKFEAFTRQSFECISVADVEGNYIYVNPAFCELMGYSEDELLELTVYDMKSATQDPGSFIQSKRSHEGEPIRVRLRRKDGTEFESEVTGKVIEYGTTTCVLGVVRDITERLRRDEEQKALERNVQHAQKLESLARWRAVSPTISTIC